MKMKIKMPNYLKGTINISGSKNTTLPLIAASILTNEDVILNNVPFITDVINMMEIAIEAKGKLDYNKLNRRLRLNFRKISTNILSDKVASIRASYYFIGSILSRKGKIKIKQPGGCNFSVRPIDYHLEAFKQLGYKVTLKKGYILIKKRKIKNKRISIKLPKPSVGTTINILLNTVCSNKIVEIENYSHEPDVLSVIEMLNQMGSNILFKENKLVIYGVKKLFGTTYDIPFDRIEAGSYMILSSIIPKSKVILENVNPCKLEKVIEVLRKMNVRITYEQRKLIIESPNVLKPITIKTGEYPEFPTDLQQIILILLLKAQGKSKISDTIYPQRTSQIEELVSSGANIYIHNNDIVIDESILNINIATAKDLRGGFSLILLSALTKELTINNFEVIKRGYEDIEEKLKKLKIIIEKEN